MPIKGLTSRDSLEKNATKQLDTGGTISKGLPRTPQQIAKNQPGEEKDYFIFRLRGKYNTQAMRDAIEAEFGKEPKILKPVFVVGRDYEEAFPTSMEKWGKSGLSIRCDGEHQLEWWDDENGGMSRDCKACIAPHCGCQRSGRLFIVLPSLAERTGFVLQFMLTTHSSRDTQNISAKLLWAEGLGLKLYQIPFMLEREPGEVNIPLKDKETGKYYRGKATKYFVAISVDPGFIKQIGAPQYAALPATVSGGATVPSSNGHEVEEETHIDWANKQTVSELLQRCADVLGMTSKEVEGHTGFSVTNYPEWNRRFKDRTVAGQFLKTAHDNAIEASKQAATEPDVVDAEIVEDQQEPPEIDREAMERDIQAVREALIATGLQSSAIDTIAPQGDHFGVAITMGVTATDLKGIKKSKRLELVDSSDEFVWVKLKGE